MFEFEENLAMSAKIKVVGVGGGGGNAIKTMMKERIAGVDFIAVNTDVQSLRDNDAMVKIQIGSKLTRGLGAGANPQVGRDAAMEDAALIGEALAGSDMVFVTAGMGGGTGTGAVPVIAKIARDMGILTVCVVTKPFSFEGKKRMRQAETGIAALQEAADTLICVPNDNMLNIAGKETPITDSFKMVDQVLLQAVRGISDLITTPGLINLDFSDIREIMKDAGLALMGTGIARGESRALEAAKMAISSPILQGMSITGATGVLLNFNGSSNMTLFEVNEASKLIQQECHEEANIIFGTVIDENMGDGLRITVIATGFGKELENIKQQARQESSAARDRALFAPRARASEAVSFPRSEASATAPLFAERPAPQPALSLRDVFEAPAKTVEPQPAPLFAGGPVDQALPFAAGADESDAGAGSGEDDESVNDIAEQLLRGARQPQNEPSLFTARPASVWGAPPQAASAVAGAVSSEASAVPPRVSRRRTESPVEEKSVSKKVFGDMGLGDGETDEFSIPAFIRRRAD